MASAGMANTKKRKWRRESVGGRAEEAEDEKKREGESEKGREREDWVMDGGCEEVEGARGLKRDEKKRK